MVTEGFFRNHPSCTDSYRRPSVTIRFGWKMNLDGYRRFSVTILISIICGGQLEKTFCNHPITETDTETDTDSRRFRNQVLTIPNTWRPVPRTVTVQFMGTVTNSGTNEARMWWFKIFQVLSPDEDVVACIYLGYNPHCISALNCFRCCPLTRMWWCVSTWGTTLTVSVPWTVSGTVPWRGCGGVYLPGVQPSLYQCLELFQVLSPDEDVVACIYLGYNPQTRCAVHVHVYRCDSMETAAILTAHLNQLIELPEHQQRVLKIEQELVNKGQVGSDVSTWRPYCSRCPPVDCSDQ